MSLIRRDNSGAAETDAVIFFFFLLMFRFNGFLVRRRKLPVEKINQEGNTGFLNSSPKRRLKISNEGTGRNILRPSRQVVLRHS